ncbi:MAG TPA: ECF-type sigma factor [Acidobacteriaceae bacterium]|nr:ECF-type sigma factor [Acidobacteriaceae bacterium]
MGGPKPDKISLDAAMPQLYEELHRIAHIYMSRERGSHTLQPTALIHETYLRMLGQHSVDFRNRAQVLGVAAQMMRRILVNHGEGKNAAKRGADCTMVYLSDSPDVAQSDPVLFDELDQALDRLAAMDERQAKVVELRVFGGLTVDEVAEFLRISVATVHRDWASGRLWLAHALTSS